MHYLLTKEQVQNAGNSHSAHWKIPKQQQQQQQQQKQNKKNNAIKYLAMRRG